MHRLKGELLLRQDDSNAAEAQSCFQRAIEIARKQSAKSLELRATMSLARLLAKQGRRDEARTMLAEIYGWFTEGFDTADLKDAKALLDELAAHRMRLLEVRRGKSRAAQSFACECGASSRSNAAARNAVRERADAKFCGECGAPLERPRRQRHSDKCRHDLTIRVTPRAAASETSRASARR